MLTIYKASAGSGKTYNLALTYIRHLLGYRNAEQKALRPRDGRHTAHNHRSIMAITFTNAATEEMKSRIIKRLHELATAPLESSYRKELTDTFGENLEAIQAAAANALSELLYDYSNFYVSTIDSFFQTVLRTFAREVDQQGDYDLSLDQKTIIPEVISLMLEELNRDPAYADSPLYGWMLKQTMELAEKGSVPNYFDRNSTMVSTLAKNVEASLDEVYHSESEALDEYLADPARLQAFVDELNGRMNALSSKLKKQARAIREILKKYPDFKLKTLLDRVIKIASINPRDIDKKDILSATISNIIQSDTPWRAIANKDQHELIPKAEFETLGSICRDFALILTDAQNEFILYPILLDGALELQFLSLFRDYLERYLRENNTLLISDTGELINRIISDQEMPFIYERLGMKLRSLLIDEFQDTSKLQWINLKPLVTNSVAGGNESLIIGDVKQSIYRFRNSDSTLLDHVVQTDTAFSGRIAMRGSEPADNTNYRSAADIIRFNNVLFHTINDAKPMPGYNTVIQEIPDDSKKIPARIRLLVSLKKEKGTTVDKDMYSDWQLETLAQSILDQHARGYRWRDIAILVNTHKQAKIIVSYLLQNHPDIRILSNEALLLSNSPAVRTVMSILSLVQQDIVDNPRAEKTESDGAHVKIHSKADLTSLLTQFNYFRSQGIPPQEALQSALEALDGAEKSTIKEKIHNIRDHSWANLVALIENIIAQEVSETDRREQNVFLAALQDRAIAHCASTDPSVAAFIRAYELNVNRWAIKAPGSLDAVKVMTIHASKGLEWPCVHIPYATWNLFKGGKMWFRLPDGLPADMSIGVPAFRREIVPPILRLSLDSEGILYNSANFRAEAISNKAAEEADNLNKLYVALTRAGRELDVHFQDNHRLSGTTHEMVQTALTYLDNAVQTDDRLLSFTLNRIGATMAHNELLELDFCTNGTKPIYTPIDGESKEQPIEDAYEVVLRADPGNLLSIEDLFDPADPMIGNEEAKEIVERPLPYTVSLARAANRGLHLHSVLADMERISDMERSLLRLQARHQLEQKVIDDYRAILTAAFKKTPLAAEWFDPENTVWNEQNIYDPNADNTDEEIKRPDRIVRRPDGQIVLVDYKFTYSTSDDHKIQVKNYMNLLSDMGFDNIKGYLWYPRKPLVVEVI